MKYDLSVIIPSRNEMFLARTIDDLLEHIEGNTEIIVGLDGKWSDPPLVDHPRLTVVYYPESIGQRAMSNQLVQLSNAKYVMKVDAHCAFDQGFDVKMIEAYKELGDDVTMVPVMRNLHAFNWVCPDGHTRYQGPSGPCKEVVDAEKGTLCGKDVVRDVVWIPKTSPRSTSYSFDPEPHFQYFGEWKKKQVGDLVETMSLQGSCFMLTREKYWSLGICDEFFGSWGSQGIEVSVKTRLSGGNVICNKRTWYAHMFRTQGGDFSFPYQQKQSKVDEAKKKAKDLFFDNKWDKQIYPLSTIIEHFWPVNHWTEEDLKKLKQREIETERSGIYSIKSSETGRVYIGSAINIANRIFEHTRKLKQNDHHNIHLQNVYNKYGADDLKFEVLYFCSNDDLLTFEQKFIDECKEDIGWDMMFNIEPTAGSSLGRVCSDETKEKISIAQTGKTAWNKGLTKETDDRVKKYCEKLKGGHPWNNKEHPRGMLGKKHTEETKQRISNSSKDMEHTRNDIGQFVKKPTKAIIYYTDNQLKLKIAHAVQKQLRKVSEEKDIPIVSASLKPMTNMGTNIHVNMEYGRLAMMTQILAALEASTADIVYFCEHDVLYHSTHFDFTPPERGIFYYDQNWWKVRTDDSYAIHYDANQLSGLCCYRETALPEFRERVRRIQKEGWRSSMGYEPGTRGISRGGFSDSPWASWKAPLPSIDIKHGRNLTTQRWQKENFHNQQNCQGWAETTADKIEGWTGLMDLVGIRKSE